MGQAVGSTFFTVAVLASSAINSSCLAGIDAGIDRVVATNGIGRGLGLAGAKPQGATQQLLHHQSAHRAIGIGNLGLASATTNQIAIADCDRAVLLAANSPCRDDAERGDVINGRDR